jgi:hypothetical protein
VRALTVVARSRALAYALGGVVLLALPWIAASGGRTSPVFRAITAVLGVITLAAGIGNTPPVLRRLARR